MYRRIILSAGAIGLVGTLGLFAANATGAFFSDTQSSVGNVFTAGGISLNVDSTQHYNNAVCVLTDGGPAATWQLAPDATAQADQYPVIGSPCTGTWLPTTLGPTNQFFNFTDVKPQDQGENTISLDNLDNPAWACANISLTDNNASGTTPPAFDGSLAQSIQVFAWRDDGTSVEPAVTAGDNVYEPADGETPLSGFVGGPVTLASLVGGGTSAGNATIAIADSVTGGTPLPAGATSNIGLAWCAGTMTVNPTTGAIGCDGTLMTTGQGDSLSADITLMLEQSRNQPNYTCSGIGEPQTFGVTADTLSTNGSNGTNGNWNFFNDTNNTIDNTLGSFVTGPGTPPAGTGSAQVTLADGTSRVFFNTTAYGGVTLASISQMSFSEYAHSGAWSTTEAPFLRFNVDFTTGSPTYQNSLVYVPSANGTVTQDTWQTWNTTTPGSLWNYSGSVWPTPTAGPDNGVVGTPGTTNKTWATILADYPNIRMWAAGPQLGLRVGEPGPAGFIANLDKFQINTGSGLKTYDFGN